MVEGVSLSGQVSKKQQIPSSQLHDRLLVQIGNCPHVPVPKGVGLQMSHAGAEVAAQGCS